MATAKLSRNTHLGKFSLGGKRRRAFAHLNRNPHRGSGKLSYESHRNRWIGENIFSGTEHQIRFAYDGNEVVLQFDKDGSGTLDASNLSHRYTWLPNAVDQLMSDEQVSTPAQSGQVVWTLGDNQGTIKDLAVMDSGVTSVVNHRVFDSFGNLTSAINPSTNQAATVDCLFGYTGRAKDSVTGLQNNGERWYDPIIAGWLSQDPIGFKSGTTNLYVYCGNNPTNATDPSGLIPAIAQALICKLAFGPTEEQDVPWSKLTKEEKASILEAEAMNSRSVFDQEADAGILAFLRATNRAAEIAKTNVITSAGALAGACFAPTGAAGAAIKAKPWVDPYTRSIPARWFEALEERAPAGEDLW